MPIAALLPILIEVEAKTNSPDLTRYVLVCVAMLGLVFVLAYGFRRLMLGNLKRRAAARSLQVVDMLPMGGKQRLVVVRCYDRHFLIGLGDKELSSIAELEAGSDELPSSSVFHDPSASSAMDKRGFTGALESVMRKWRRPNDAPEASSRAGIESQPKQPTKERQSMRPSAAKPGSAARPLPRSVTPARQQASAEWNREEGILG